MPFGEALKPKWSHTEKPCVGKGNLAPLAPHPNFQFFLLSGMKGPRRSGKMGEVTCLLGIGVFLLVVSWSTDFSR